MIRMQARKQCGSCCGSQEAATGSALAPCSHIISPIFTHVVCSDTTKTAMTWLCSQCPPVKASPTAVLWAEEALLVLVVLQRSCPSSTESPTSKSGTTSFSKYRYSLHPSPARLFESLRPRLFESLVFYLQGHELEKLSERQCIYYAAYSSGNRSLKTALVTKSLMTKLIHNLYVKTNSSSLLHQCQEYPW
jgi:hypothetical protein